MVSEESKALELILQYDMDEIESKAFKISLIYLERSKKLFPDYKHCRLPKGDPRKSELFKHCHKLLRTKGDKIADEDYKLYVHAQLDILRNIKKGEIHPFISPACLAGDKAWKRWLLWKNKYDKMVESRMSSASAASINIHSSEKIKKDLWKTKQFFLAWFDRLDKSDIKQSLDDGNIFLWFQCGSVCGYYLLLSPVVIDWMREKKFDIKKELGIDLSPYKDVVQPEVTEYFYSEFAHENTT